MRDSNGTETTPGRKFVVSSGALLVGGSANQYTLFYDDLKTRGVPFRFISGEHGVLKFRYNGSGQPRHGIHMIEIAKKWNGKYWLGKYYQGNAQPIYHQGWDGRWVQ